MRTRRAFLGLTAVLLLASAALLELAPPSPRRSGGRTGGRATPGVTSTSALRRPANEVTVAVASRVAPEGSTREALESLGRKAHANAAAARDAEQLERELVATATGADKMDLRVRLERLLLERPELAPGVARAFGQLHDRETLFVVSRALVGCVEQSLVRSTLEDAARGGHSARREVALVALPGDARGLALARTALDDATAAPTVRAAGAYALARGYEVLDDREKSAAVGAARSLAAAPAEDAHLRAEALHLLARASDRDAALSRAVLEEPGTSAELALAAAHLALAQGAEPAVVAARLTKHPERACALAAQNLVNPRRSP